MMKELGRGPRGSKRDDFEWDTAGCLMRRLTSFLIIVVVLSAATFVAWQLYLTKPEAERTVDPVPPPMVRVYEVARQDIPRRFVGYGTARADRETTVSAEVSGVVVGVPRGVKDGSDVDAGDVLARLDDRDYVQQMKRADAMAADAAAQLQRLVAEEVNLNRLLAIAERDVEIYRSEVDRLSGLFESERAAKTEFNQTQLAYQRSRREAQTITNEIDLLPARRAAMEAARDVRLAEAALAALNIERSVVRAPFAGQIETMFVEDGDRVAPGGPVARILSTREIEVPVEMPAAARMYLKVGADCILKVESLRGSRWLGRIARVAPSADASSRTFRVYVMVDNAESDVHLAPGFFVRAEAEGPDLEGVLAIPRGAVVDDHVFVVDDAAEGPRAEERKVRIEGYQGAMAVVTGEIAAGDRVIVSNLDILADGAEIRTSVSGAAPLANRTDASRVSP
jgi:RND family efflux transporter MFP subunit